ncbi:MAG: hypothetical protein ACRYFA_11275 [Janthinobacterium lividum]
MQNLYMMATLIREQQMQKMAIEIITKKISVEQAMVQYNVSTKEAVITRVEALKEGSKHTSAKNQSETIDFNVIAA